jgi:Holliday junction resolvase RusA-like endonuclease
MSKCITYVVKGRPISWTRPRLNGKRFFDAQAEDKVCWGLNLQREHGDRSAFATAVEMTITFYFKGKNEAQNAKNLPKISRPDLDNLIKFVLDAAQDAGIFHDDAIIVSLIARKLFSNDPRTEFTIREVE